MILQKEIDIHVVKGFDQEDNLTGRPDSNNSISDKNATDHRYDSGFIEDASKKQYDREEKHYADQQVLRKCIRSQVKSSAEAAVILEQIRALQGMPKTDHELKMETCKVWCRVFWASLLLFVIFQIIDTGADLIVLFK